MQALDTDCITLAILTLGSFQSFNKAHFSLVWYVANDNKDDSDDLSHNYKAFVSVCVYVHCTCVYVLLCCMPLLLANLRGKCVSAVTDKLFSTVSPGFN